MGANDTFVYGLYLSDNTSLYVIKLSRADATAGGFTLTNTPLQFPAWPFNTKDLRHVTGEDMSNVNRHGKLCVATPLNGLYVNGGQWTNGNTGRSYNVLGAMGERRPASHLGG